MFQGQIEPLLVILRESKRSWRAATWLVKYLDQHIQKRQETPEERRERNAAEGYELRRAKDLREERLRSERHARSAKQAKKVIAAQKRKFERQVDEMVREELSQLHAAEAARKASGRGK